MNKIDFICKTRPCWVDGRRAIFHRWTDSARPVKPRGMEDEGTAERYQLHSVHALVEYEDGTMERVWPNTVQFADSEILFSDYDWEAMEEERDAAAGITVHGGMGYMKTCSTCAYKNEKATICPDNVICCECPLPCACKNCRDYDNWEPKGGTV